MKSIIVVVSKQNSMFICVDIKKEAVYRAKEMVVASLVVTMPLGIGRYGLEILSVSTSDTWFNALDAPFNMPSERDAERIR